jgi:hypothetical protein
MLTFLLKSGLIMSLLSSYAFADAAPDATSDAQRAAANAQAHQESVDQHRVHTNAGQFARAASTYYYNADTSKIDVLYGKWQITIQMPQIKTETLEISTTVTDKNFGYSGWDSKRSMSCFYEPKILHSIYNYECLHVTDATTGIAQRYLFNVNGTTLTGKYHEGTAADFITKLNANQLYNLSGSSQSIIEPYYNDVKGELIIPKVSAFGKRYRVIMKHENNGQFSLQSADPL